MAHERIENRPSATPEQTAPEAELFVALGHPVRLRLLELLADGPRCACELEPQFNLNQSTVSRHLNTLQRAGILRSHKEGVKVSYEIRDERVWEIIERARAVIDDALSDAPTPRAGDLEEVRPR